MIPHRLWADNSMRQRSSSESSIEGHLSRHSSSSSLASIPPMSGNPELIHKIAPRQETTFWQTQETLRNIWHSRMSGCCFFTNKTMKWSVIMALNLRLPSSSLNSWFTSWRCISEEPWWSSTISIVWCSFWCVSRVSWLALLCIIAMELKSHNLYLAHTLKQGTGNLGTTLPLAYDVRTELPESNLNWMTS